VAKLKTYVAEAGFYEIAVAAPSMKAALAAWGMTHNAFHQGFARQSEDAAIIAAVTAAPGTVLRRPLGTKGPFKQSPDAPVAPQTKATTKARKPEKKPDAGKIRTAEQALATARAAHDKRNQALRRQQHVLEEKLTRENDAWQAEEERLEAALAKSRR
jgi:colicin import membrane protein